jgi:hypothetical protein
MEIMSYPRGELVVGKGEEKWYNISRMVVMKNDENPKQTKGIYNEYIG